MQMSSRGASADGLLREGIWVQSWAFNQAWVTWPPPCGGPLTWHTSLISLIKECCHSLTLFFSFPWQFVISFIWFYHVPSFTAIKRLSFPQVATLNDASVLLFPTFSKFPLTLEGRCDKDKFKSGIGKLRQLSICLSLETIIQRKRFSFSSWLLHTHKYNARSFFPTDDLSEKKLLP